MSKLKPTEGKLGIKSWSEEDRPREKLQLKGRENLSNAELIGILLGSGTTEYSAVDVGKLVLQTANNNLNLLSQMSISDLCKVPGIGPARAITLIAAIELGRRRKASDIQNAKITSSNDAYEHIYPFLADLNHERFFIMLLNRANKVVKTSQISKGGVSGTVVDPKVVFANALEVSTVCSMILCHNHPSGNLKPSKEDINITTRLVNGAKLLDLNVLDHIIVGDQSYYSFADEGIMPGI